MKKFFSQYRIIFYFSNLVLIMEYIYPGSLIGCFIFKDCKIQPQITKDFIISTNHFCSFFLLSLIGFFTYLRPNQFYVMILFLILLSIILEMLHLIIPERSFEYKDLFGNIFGVLSIIIINFFFKKI